jgi:hypothetical protein
MATPGNNGFSYQNTRRAGLTALGPIAFLMMFPALARHIEPDQIKQSNGTFLPILQLPERVLVGQATKTD